MIGLEEGQAVGLAFGRAQMDEMDARRELPRHRGRSFSGAHAEAPVQKQMPFACDGTASNSA